MTAYLIKLRQNIFPFTLAAAGLLGLSLAHLLDKSILLSLSNAAPAFLAGGSSGIQQRQTDTTPIPNQSEIEGLATGNLLRGTLVSETTEEEEVLDVGNLSLVGVLSGSPRYARAVILSKDDKTVEAYSIGDTIRDGKIIAIRSISVIFANKDGDRLTLTLGSDVSSSPSSVKSVVKGPKSGRVEKITLSRDRFKQLIKNQAEIFRLKFAPSLKGGKVDGWRLLKVPNDHFLHSMGARSGDIIRRYNGQELESQDRMIQMWQSLQSANQVSVDIERGGRLITYDIVIR